MKQIVFISGKGGTGKSTVVASLAKLTENKMIADCDVDAPNLHLLIKGEEIYAKSFYGAKEAFISDDACICCVACRDVCRFNAISEDFEIIPFKCEGCGACTLVCPTNAISLEEMKTGDIYVSKAKEGTFSHALLDIGAEGSGRLVTEVRKIVKNHEEKEDYLLIDGAPGTGCVVIASITGADAVVVVSEPTQSGISDLKRVLGVAEHFGIPGMVCINKFDLNTENTAEIERYCEENGIRVVGKISFEPRIVDALRELKTPVEAGLQEITGQIKELWENVKIEITE